MIYIRPIGGLCNRMRSVASAITLARQYNTEVTVYWYPDKGLNCRFRDLFDEIDNVKVKEVSTRFLPIICYLRAKIDKSFSAYPDLHWKDKDFVENDVKNGKNVFIKTYFIFTNEVDYSVFKVIDAIKEKAQQYLPEKINNLIGVHIRRTDHVKSIEQSPTELFVEKMNDICAKNPDTVFYLATDSLDEEKKLRELFPDKIYSNIHRELSRNCTDGIVDALVDVYCLSKAKTIIGSYWSSFSGVASLWGEQSELIIINNGE